MYMNPSVLKGQLAKTPSTGGKSSPTDSGGHISNQGLNLLLKRPWDPAQPIIRQNKPKKLDPTRSPIVIVVPCSPKASPIQARRHRHFNSQLHSVTSVYAPQVPYYAERGLESWMESVVASVRGKIQDVRRKHRPIVLMGWESGALLACQLSLVEQEGILSGVVCLSLPFYDAADLLHTQDVRSDIISSQNTQVGCSVISFHF